MALTINHEIAMKHPKQFIPGAIYRKKAAELDRKLGMPPGSLIHVGEQKTETTVISLIDYDVDQMTEQTVETLDACLPFKDRSSVTWINIDGLHDVSVIDRIGKLFDIHPLVLEDVLNTVQSPKIEEHDQHLFIVLKALRYEATADAILEDQLSIIVGRNILITFQEHPNDLLKPVRDRIRNGRSRIRKRSSDYLMYALLDTVVDHHLMVLDVLGEKLDRLETASLDDITQLHLQSVFALKKKLFAMRKVNRPLREIVGNLLKSECELIDDSNRIYFRDVNDHLIHLVDGIEVYRELINSLVDTYLSTLSLRMNEVMKVLTIAAAVFMPLTFLVGVYGMNFEHMPELGWRWGYFMVWGVMIATILVLLAFFRRRSWL
jgi:magnesium transporter